MNANFVIKRTNIDELKQMLARAESDLNNEILNCIHKWGDTIADPIYTKGYWIDGEIGWRASVWVEPTTKLRWKRICNNCGKEEITVNVEETVIKNPKFK